MDVIRVLKNPSFFVDNNIVFKNGTPLDAPLMKMIFPDYVAGNRLGVTLTGEIYEFSTNKTYKFNSKVLAVYTGDFINKYMIWFDSKEVHIFANLDSTDSTLIYTDVEILTRYSHRKISPFIVITSKDAFFERFNHKEAIELQFSYTDVQDVIHKIFILKDQRKFMVSKKVRPLSNYAENRVFQKCVRETSC